mmetsp:Transcript_40326/g.86043  ORF Transcript_40326/g.86043 Transcript_40326/m.86043 type:complete len:399 (-) Transcript_40326:81-1277(-)
MPLKFEEPEGEEKNEDKSLKPTSAKDGKAAVKNEKEELSPRKSRSPFGRKKKDKDEDDGSVKLSTASHRRVFTKSSQYFALFKIKVMRAKDLPAKKSIQPYVQIYLGSNAFNTKVKKKTLNPEYNEEFEAQIDRDDSISLKIWDMGKFERQTDTSKKIEPICKKKIAVKDFAREGNISCDKRAIQMVGGGTLEVEITFEMNIPQLGEVHTKTFSYPSWMTDRYGMNQIEPDVQSNNVGWTTVARYTSRWLLNQRAIQASLQKDEEEEEEAAGESDVPDGLKFRLIDISCCAHDKALQLVVTYTWEKPEEIDEDEYFSRPKILTYKLFTTPIKIAKKKLYDHKGMNAKSYQDLFNKVCDGTEEVMANTRTWMKDNSNEIFKLIPITTPHTHHVLLWYYK